MTGHRPEWPADPVTRWSRRILGFASLLVPIGLRREWRLEWEAELWQLRRPEGNRVRLGLFLVGAFVHGLWEWKEEWRMESFVQDLRYAARALVRSPGFALAALTILTLSIGANTALFSVVREALLTPPPYDDPGTLVVVDVTYGMEDEPQAPAPWSYPRYRAAADELASVRDIAGYAARTMTLTDAGNPAVVRVEAVTPTLFPLLGVGAWAGRTFGDEERDRGAPVLRTLLGHAIWQERFGGDPGVVGTVVTLDRLRFEVVGVLEPGFAGVTGDVDLWIPCSALREVENESFLDNPWNSYLNVIGRLAPEATVESARAEMQAFAAVSWERFPPPVAASRLTPGGDVVPFVSARINPGARASMLVLFGAVALVLLVATANLSGLLLARGASRQREAAVRASLGAGRTRLLRQLLTEGLLLAGLGGALGVALSGIAIDTLGTWLTEAVGTGGGRELQFLDPARIAIDWTVVLFAIAVTAGVGVVFGILPAWQAARVDPASTLRGVRAPAPGFLRARPLSARSGLIVLQVAVALVLLSGASLMMQSLALMQEVELGYDPGGLVTAVYGLTPMDVQAGVDPSTFHLDYLGRVRALPGVAGATLAEVPLGGPTWRTIVLGSEGRPELTPADHLWIRMQPIPEGHFAVMGTGLLEGRGIESTDDRDSEKVIVLSRTAADELFPDGGAVGRRIQLSTPGWGSGVTVVGIAEDQQMAPPGELSGPQGYISIRQAARLETGVLVRVDREATEVTDRLRATLAELNPNIALTSVMSMRDRALTVTARRRIVSALMMVFAAVSLLLVAVGLYGTIAFAVARRTRELGLRASLGADRTSLAGLVLRQGLGLTAVGIGIGLVGASWATRFLEGLLFGTDGIDAHTLVGVCAVLMAVALAAAWLPARRAMRVDPMTALRTE